MRLDRLGSFHSPIISLLLVVGTLSAQTTDTGILGTVADSTGAVVAGATVSITQPATGQTRAVTTNSEGYYEVRYLLPGEYTAEVRASGFRTERQTGIVLQIGQQARINFSMQVAAR